MPSATAPEPHPVPIRDEMIRLGQFLQLAQIAIDATAGKALLADGLVHVNAQPETRRGRQLVVDDVVTVSFPDGPLRFQVSQEP